MVDPDPFELLEVVVDVQQTSPTPSPPSAPPEELSHPVQCETDPTALNRVVVYDDLTYTPPSVSTFEFTPRGHDELHYESETSSASNIRGQHSSLMPTPETTSSTVQLTDTVSTFQSGKDEEAAGTGELTSLAATQRVILTPSLLRTIKQGFSCVVCLDFIKEPVFAQCCRSIIGCKTCVERSQQAAARCPKCRGNTAGNNIIEVAGLSEALSVLRSLSEED